MLHVLWHTQAAEQIPKTQRRDSQNHLQVLLKKIEARWVVRLVSAIQELSKVLFLHAIQFLLGRCVTGRTLGHVHKVLHADISSIYFLHQKERVTKSWGAIFKERTTRRMYTQTQSFLFNGSIPARTRACTWVLSSWGCSRRPSVTRQTVRHKNANKKMMKRKERKKAMGGGKSQSRRKWKQKICEKEEEEEEEEECCEEDSQVQGNRYLDEDSGEVSSLPVRVVDQGWDMDWGT